MQILRWKAALMAAISASVALSGAAGGVQNAPANSPDVKTSAVVVKDSEPAHGWSLAVAQEKGPREVGGHAWIRIDLRNGSSAVMDFLWRGAVADFSFNLRRNDAAVPLTRFGERMMRWVKDGPISGPARTVKLGESWASYLDLARMFDLSDPGTYLLTVEKAWVEPGSRVRISLIVRDVTIEVSAAVAAPKTLVAHETTGSPYDRSR
jgi:hypothetical protein